MKRNNDRKVIQQGDAYRDRKLWGEAASAYKTALDSDPTLAGIWVQYGHCLKEGGDRIGAEAAYLKALEIKPAEADTYLQLGHLKKLQNDLRRAATYYKEAATFDPELDYAVQELAALELRGIRPLSVRAKRRIPEHGPAIPESDQGLDEPVPDIDVTIIGKFGTSNGIALHTHAFSRCLREIGWTVQGLDTRPHESDVRYKRKISTFEIVNDPEDAEPALTSIFCDVIANSENDHNTDKVPPSLVKLAFAVFDSSQIPGFWVDRLNAFDAVAVPDKWLVKVLKDSGVYQPVFTLPLALDYKYLSAARQTALETETISGDGTAFTFGCVAGFGLRKNLKGLIDAFSDCFSNNDAVRLHIHSTLNFSNHYEELLDYAERIGLTNTLLTCDELSDAKYAAMLDSFDVYVNVSKGEGFSITPRQAMFLKKPTILSNNTAHRTIVDSGLVLSVPTALYERAQCEALGHIECGYQCVPDQDQLKRALLTAFTQHAKLRSKGEEMRQFAELYSIDSLCWSYGGFALPKNVFLSDRNEIDGNCMITDNVALYKKMEQVNKLVKARIPASGHQNITVIGHDGGFFSVFNTYISHLVWNMGRPEIDSIVPDWRVSKIQSHRGLRDFKSFCYGTRADGNLWLKFCYPVFGQQAQEDDYNNSEFLDTATHYDDFNEKHEPNLTYINAYKLYKSLDFPQWRQRYFEFLNKYVRFRDHITSEVETFRANWFKSDYIVGCHVRHPSHGIEQPGRGMPTIELYIQHIIRRTAGIKDYLVFLATDQESVVDSFRKIFGERLIHRSEVARVTPEHDQKFENLSEEEKNKEGHQIQHLMAADESRWSTVMGDQVIVDTLLLAKCNTFIHVTSNIATAVSFLNPTIEMIYCE